VIKKIIVIILGYYYIGCASTNLRTGDNVYIISGQLNGCRGIITKAHIILPGLIENFFVKLNQYDCTISGTHSFMTNQLGRINNGK
jgi:hypothetical protein